MSELTTTQKKILEAAARRADGSIHPLPGQIKGIVARKVIDSLRNKGLIQVEADLIHEAGYRAVGLEPPQPVESSRANGATAESPLAEAQEGAENDTDPLNALFDKIAMDHLAIDTLQPRQADNPEFQGLLSKLKKALHAAYNAGMEAAPPKVTPRKSGPRENSKQAQVIALLKRPEGATVAQIAAAIGWQAHAIRSFLSVAKKKLGLEITTQRTRTMGPNQQDLPSSYSTYFAR